MVNQPADLNVVPAGGNPGYTFSWDLNNDGTFGDATGLTTPTYTFTTTGPHTVSVKITDTGAGGNPSHTTTVTKTINVVTPPTHDDDDAAAAPPPCRQDGRLQALGVHDNRLLHAGLLVTQSGPVDDDVGREAQRDLAPGLRTDLHHHRADDRRTGRALHRPQLDDAARWLHPLLGQHRLVAPGRWAGSGAGDPRPLLLGRQRRELARAARRAVRSR